MGADAKRVRIFLLLSWVLSASSDLQTSRKVKQKPQLFREHIAPELGGRIPDSAFQADRISLNRLSQNGFFTHDGLHIQQRMPNNHPLPRQAFPSTYKIVLQVDNSNVAPEGRLHQPEVVDTSYLNPSPVHFIIIPNLEYHPVPIMPMHSLDLFHNSKEKQKGYGDLDEFEILKEFAPYLEKLHLDD